VNPPQGGDGYLLVLHLEQLLLKVSHRTSANSSSAHFQTAHNEKKYGGEEFCRAAIGIDQATSRVKAGSGKSARAAQRDALKAPTVYRFKNLLCDEDGRTIQ